MRKMVDKGQRFMTRWSSIKTRRSRQSHSHVAVRSSKICGISLEVEEVYEETATN
jgi:hypothetical protein